MAAFRFLLPFLTVVFLSIPAFSNQDEIQIEYSSSVSDQATGIFLFQHPRVKMTDSTLSGAEAEYDQQSKIMTVKGNIVVYSTNMILTADRAVLNLNTSKYVLYNATFFDQKNVVYGKAEQIETLNDDTYKLLKGEITTCQPKEKVWELSSSKIVYQVDNYAYSVNSIIYLYSLPIFYSPFISWPTKEQRSTGFLPPEISHQSSSDDTKTYGNRLKIPYFIALDRDHDLTVKADLIERRGLGIDLDYQYAFVAGMSGQFKGWYLDESVQDRDLALENLGTLDATHDEFDLRPTRYTYHFNHKQSIPFGGTLTLEQLERSDNEIHKEYFGSEANLETESKQAVDVSYPIPNGSFSLAYSTINKFTQTSVYDTTTDKETAANIHPSVSVSQQYSTIGGSPLSLSLSGTRVYYDRIYGWDGEATTSSIQADFPFSLDFLNVRPTLTRDYHRYKPSYDYRSGEDTSADLDNVAEFGWKVDTKEIEFNFEIFRYFTNEDNQKTGKLSFIPRLIYAEIEDVEQVSPAGFGIAETTLSKKSLTYQLDTVFKTRNPENNNIRNFFKLSLIQPFDLNSVNCAETADEAPEYCVDHHPDNSEVEIGEQQLPLRISATLNPTDRLSGSLFFRYNHQQNEVQETRISLTTAYLDGGSFSLSYVDNSETYRDLDNTNHPSAQTYQIANSFPINERLQVSVSGKWDQARSKSSVRFVDSSSVKRLDRTLKEFDASLAYKHPCYTFTTTYSEKIKEREIGSAKEEYLNKTFTFTFSLPLIPFASSSGLGSMTYQDDYEFR